METKNRYTKPEIEFIDLESTGIIATSIDVGDVEDADPGTPANAPGSFWN